MDDTLYKQFILDHYKNPKNFGKLEAGQSVKVENSSCGDEIMLSYDIEDGILVDLKFEARGCAISIASMSMLSEQIKGKKVSELKEITVDDILKNLNMPSSSGRIKCATLAYDALLQILSDLSSESTLEN